MRLALYAFLAFLPLIAHTETGDRNEVGIALRKSRALWLVINEQTRTQILRMFNLYRKAYAEVFKIQLAPMAYDASLEVVAQQKIAICQHDADDDKRFHFIEKDDNKYFSTAAAMTDEMIYAQFLAKIAKDVNDRPKIFASPKAVVVGCAAYTVPCEDEGACAFGQALGGGPVVISGGGPVVNPGGGPVVNPGGGPVANPGGPAPAPGPGRGPVPGGPGQSPGGPGQSPGGPGQSPGGPVLPNGLGGIRNGTPFKLMSFELFFCAIIFYFL